MIRFGLCCIFKNQPIKFRRATARHLSTFSRQEQLRRLAELCLLNAQNLLAALKFCRDHGIGDFRINSQILPLKTHPEIGYDIKDLPGGSQIVKDFKFCGRFCKQHNIRTTFHPDQFVILSSPDPDVVSRSIAELEYQAQVSQWVNSDVITIHGGGVYGDKKLALTRLRKRIEALSRRVKKRLTLENDDRSYTPEDLLPVCRDTNIPLVYDVHHHRCLADSLSIEKATAQAIRTWAREPLFHISSPLSGWHTPDIRKHHDYIDAADFPTDWLKRSITVEVEGKAKESAVLKLIRDLEKR